jgi:predicted RNA-binding protein with PUA-like domain
MTTWLGKIDPENLSIDDIQSSGTALWKKVRHPKAMQYMGQMIKGEKMLVYHSNEKQIVGVVEIISNNPDPDHPRGRLVEVKFVKKFDGPLISLSDVKTSGKFDDFRLVREPRLSVMEVSDEFLKYFKIRL